MVTARFDFIAEGQAVRMEKSENTAAYCTIVMRESISSKMNRDVYEMMYIRFYS